MAFTTIIRRLCKSLFCSNTAKMWPSINQTHLWVEPLEERAVPANWQVTTGLAANDQVTTVGSLRWAITNAQAGDTIDFALPAVGTIATISLDRHRGQLPQIAFAVTIDGYSQGGPGAQTGRPWVQLDGTDGVGGMIAGTGLRFTGLSGGSVVQGLAIYDFDGNGISLSQTNAGITIQGCYVGNNEAGNLVVPGGGSANLADGILIKSNDNTIGGTAANTANWITDSGANGIDIISAAGNFIANNTIGSWQSTNGGNGLNGVRIASSNDNTIGATNASNFITGNGLDGVLLDGSNDNVIAQNNIGTDSHSQFANGGDGVHAINTCAGNAISKNDIAGNTKDGILLETSVTGTEIYANIIGLTGDGSRALGNGVNGVHVQGANNTVGGTGSDGNVISGNANDGLFVDGNSANDNVISANYIGTDPTGIYSIGNAEQGIAITGGSNTVGGNTSASRNVISGNVHNGILIELGGNNLVIGNYIGMNSNETAGLQSGQYSNTPSGNGENGILVSSSGNTIGGAGGVGANLPGNVISNNANSGIQVGGAGGSNNAIQGNYIGTDKNGTGPLGNGGDGINVIGGTGTGNAIGGNAARFRNVISANGKFGIEINQTVTVTENFNIIGFEVDGTTLLKNTSGGSQSGNYGSDDIHQ